MGDNNKIILEFLLKKWELLWNHYKLQDEIMEKRRNLLWIIQSFIFAAWYYSFIKSIECIYLFKILSVLIPIFGIFVNIILLIVLKRHHLSLFIDECALRDIEMQWNSLSDVVKLDRFIIDRNILFLGKSHKWYFTGETIEEYNLPKLKSAFIWLNKAIPISFILIWIVVIWVILKDYILYIINNYCPNLFFISYY